MLYLIAEADKDTPYYEFFDSMKIMNESQVRNFFNEELKAGHIPQANLDDHGIDKDFNLYDLDISDIFGVLCDNDEYDMNHNYYVSQQEVQVNEQDMYD